MTQAAEIEGRVEALLAAPVTGLGFQLLEVQFRYESRWVLRLVIDGPQGVGLDACAAVSEVAGRVLEVEDPIPHEFTLEVSSPGLFRPLRAARHFAQSVGKRVRFQLAPGFLAERRERQVRGTLVALEDEETLVVDTAGETIRLPLAGVRAARLDPDL